MLPGAITLASLEWIKKLWKRPELQMTYTFSNAMTQLQRPLRCRAVGDTNQTGNDARSARALSLFHRNIDSRFLELPAAVLHNRSRFPGPSLRGWQIATVVRLARERLHGDKFRRR